MNVCNNGKTGKEVVHPSDSSISLTENWEYTLFFLLQVTPCIPVATTHRELLWETQIGLRPLKPESWHTTLLSHWLSGLISRKKGYPNAWKGAILRHRPILFAGFLLYVSLFAGFYSFFEMRLVCHFWERVILITFAMLPCAR